MTDLSAQARRVLAAIDRQERIDFDRLGLQVGPCRDEIRALVDAGLVEKLRQGSLTFLLTTVDGAVAAAQLAREERRAGITHPVVSGGDPSSGGRPVSPVDAMGGA